MKFCIFFSVNSNIFYKVKKKNQSLDLLYLDFFQLLLKLLFQGLFDAITEYREKNKDVYGIKNSVSIGVYQPWTAREGNTGIRSHIQQQVCIELVFIYLHIK